MPERVDFLAVSPVDFRAQRFCIPYAAHPQIARERDGIAVQIQNEAGEAVALDGTQTERSGKGHRGQRVRAVEFAVNDFVAQCGPAEFTP